MNVAKEAVAEKLSPYEELCTTQLYFNKIMEQLLQLPILLQMNSNAKATKSIAKLMKSTEKLTNSIANGTNSTAKVMNSTANGTRSIAKTCNNCSCLHDNSVVTNYNIIVFSYVYGI